MATRHHTIRDGRAERPPMTAQQARTFTRESLNSYGQIAEQLTCECEPYRDTFTFNRWRAQGFSVRKGEHAIRFVSWVPVEGPEDESGESEPRLIQRRLCVFCRHQVEQVAK